jgi:hypothetical protein
MPNPLGQWWVNIDDDNDGPPSLTAGGRERGRGREDDKEDWAMLERWRMVQGVRWGNVAAMAIIMLVSSKCWVLENMSTDGLQLSHG